MIEGSVGSIGWSGCLTIESPPPGVGPPLLSYIDEFEPSLMQLDRKEKMTYTEQAAKRKHCQRLTRWIFKCIVKFPILPAEVVFVIGFELG